ncbi:antigen peptide transporter 2a isoform X2 [Ctenopharyngodon idella]|uniref:antigen peptide transporter 2a isoform X2 n=1 Tax=Ctenopharyngodon idella TaxID=7959 RepID=UPI00222EC634|nr:antigen peptide transporter 2a isoform X2 [Ctenopharyngodon idella]
MEFKMHHAKALLVDLAISCVLHYSTSTLLKNNSSVFLLSHLWFVAGVKWVSLRCFLLSSWKDVSVRRCVAVTCLMCPVYESVLSLLMNTQPEYWSGSLSCPGKTITSTAATLIACLFWEVSFPDTKRKAESSECAETKQRNRALFMRVVRYSKPDAPLLSGAFVFLSLAVICDMCIPYYTGKVIDILGEHYQPNSFMSAIFLMGLLSLGSSLSSGLRGGLFMCTLSRLNKRVRLMLFNSLVNQEIGFFEDKKTGDLTSRLSVDTKLMSQSVAMNVNILLRSLIKSVGVLYLMVSLSWKLTLVTFIEAPLIAITQKIYNTHYEQLSKEVQDSVARANETAGEAVAGVRTVRSFRMESSEACRYDERLTDTHNLKTRRDTVRAVYLLVRRSLVYMYSNMLNSVGAAAKVFEYLDRKPLVGMDGSLHPETLTGKVHFKNLNFFYPTRPDQPALKNFSLELKPGQMTALVGMSGGGKSTCVSLLERFYQPQQGQILLDGQPLQNYQHKYLHQKVAMVGQDPVLFSGSIRDNIAYGLTDCDQKKVEDAAKEANAHDFISRLEKKYDTDVGERGCLLSGGQKQRIAIARALIRQPQVLILDEVTSSLDTESERMVQDALARRPNQTLLVIAHRLKTIERADQIIVIDKGEVVEQGTHQELMEKKGNYYKLRERLFTAEKEADEEEAKQE